MTEVWINSVIQQMLKKICEEFYIRWDSYVLEGLLAELVRRYGWLSCLKNTIFQKILFGVTIGLSDKFCVWNYTEKFSTTFKEQRGSVMRPEFTGLRAEN